MTGHRDDPPVGHPACLGLGSDTDPSCHLRRALAALRMADGIEVEAVSTAWESPAVGRPGPDFLNAALLVRTRLSRDELKDRLVRIETDLGRVRTGGPSDPVTIDIDLLAFDAEPPAPDLWALAHRSLPLAELLPDLASPATGETLAQSARRLASATRIEPRPDVLPGRPPS